MTHFGKHGRSIKNTGSVFMTGNYLSNLYQQNYLKDSTETDYQVSPHPGYPITALPVSRDVGLTNFLKIYFDFAYYLCVTPFRFRKRGVGEKEHFSIYTWLPQQVACGIAHVLCLLRIITEARLNTPDKLEMYVRNPAQYFLLVMNLFNFVYKFVFMKRMWRNQQAFLHVVNFIAGESLLPSNTATMVRRAVVIRVVLLLYTAMAFGSLVAGKYFVSSTSELTLVWWYRRLVVSTRFTFFYGKQFGYLDAPAAEDISPLDHFLLVINAVALIARYLFGFYTDLLILMSVLTLWSSAISFARMFDSVANEMDVHDHNYLSEKLFDKSKPIVLQQVNNWGKFYTAFKVIRLLSYLINDALGSIVCWFIGDAIMSYSVNMGAMLIAADPFKRFNLIFYYVCTFATLFLAGDVCKQMEAIKVWLHIDENRKSAPTDQVNIVLHEMLAKDLGIRGNNIFTITYPIAATFFGTIVTYFIICVQFNTEL